MGSVVFLGHLVQLHQNFVNSFYKLFSTFFPHTFIHVTYQYKYCERTFDPTVTANIYNIYNTTAHCSEEPSLSMVFSVKI